MSEDKYKVIFIVGPPGVGKNTQCDKLVEKYKFIHFGAGDLLRAEAKKDTEEGKLVNSLISQGKIVPVKITCSLLKKAMDESGKNNIFLIDGYPRNQENIDVWEKEMKDEVEVKGALYIEVSNEEMTKRLLGRNEGRADDNEETIKKRLDTFEKETKPIVEYFEKQGNLIKIDGMKTVDEISKEIGDKFKEKGLA